MKKIFILMAILFAMISCNGPRVDTNVYHKVEKTNDVYRVCDDLNVRVVIIDSCEYFIGNYSIPRYGFMAHKGNCKYCAERRKRELQNMIK